MNKETGGPAFPIPAIDGSCTKDANGLTYHTPFIPAKEGMTLRDYFAAAALQGYWSHEGPDIKPENCEITAQQSYQMADAMLKERAK